MRWYSIILEELVGEIWDEHDKVETEIERISDNEYLVAGKTKVEKLFECLDREAEFDVQTVSGWVMEVEITASNSVLVAIRQNDLFMTL